MSVINDINSLKTGSVTGPQRPRAEAAPVANDPFAGEVDAFEFLSGWLESDTSNLDTLAQVASAPTPPAATPSPDDDATRGIEYLVLQNRSLFAKAAPASNAPSRLLMTEDTATFQPTRSEPGIFNDANAWKLFEPGR